LKGNSTSSSLLLTFYFLVHVITEKNDSARLVKFKISQSLSYQDIRAKVNSVKQVTRVVVPGRDLDYGMIAFKDAVAEEFLAAHQDMTIGDATLTFEKPSGISIFLFSSSFKWSSFLIGLVINRGRSGNIQQDGSCSGVSGKGKERWYFTTTISQWIFS